MSVDAYQFRAASIAGPATTMMTVTPDDGANLPSGITRGLFVGTAGNVRVEDASGNIVDLNSASAQYHPLRVRRVHASGTTAEGIIALY